jgi:hypothetical protein
LYYYQQKHIQEPSIIFLSSNDVPLPYRTLLCHNNNMTPTLAKFHQSQMHLQVLHSEYIPSTNPNHSQHIDQSTLDNSRHSNIIRRCVLLEKYENEEITDAAQINISSRTAVELGFIFIHLSTLPAHLHQAILTGETPFGAILLEANVSQLCKPSAYFAIELDEYLTKSLSLNSSNNSPSISSLNLLDQEHTMASDSTSPRPAKSLLYGRCNRIYTPDGSMIAEVVEILP